LADIKIGLILDSFCQKLSDQEKRFDRFPEAEAGFYNSVKIAIALFSTIVGSYPYSHIQNWLSTNSTINGTGQGFPNSVHEHKLGKSS